MANEVKRMRYFDGLFLKQDEFNLEQDYHIRMRRLHNGVLFGWGVVKGLEVQAGPGAKEVTVTQGMALSRVTVNGEELGKEIVLPEDTPLDLSGYAANSTGYVSVAYPKDEKADVVEEKGGEEEIHWWEKTVLSYASTEPGNKQENIILAKIKIKADGTVDSGSILYKEGATAIRMYAPLTVAGGLNVGGTTDPGRDNLLVKGRCTIKGDLIVEGDTTTVSTTNLEVEDNIITVNKGTPQDQSGLEVYRGGAKTEAQLIWDEAGGGKWKAGIKGSLVDLAYGNNAGSLTDHSVADGLHRHSKLVSANGAMDPVVSVDNSGNVGVGIATPTEKLDVNGTVRANAFTGTGTNLSALNAGQLTSGTVPDARISSSFAKESDVGARFNTVSGHDHNGINSKKIPAINAAHFDSLSGANLTGLGGSQITSGVVNQAYIDPAIARKTDVGDVSALTLEIKDARGIKANLGNRLDESLTAGGQLRQHIVSPDQLTPDLAAKVNSALQPNTYDFTRRVTANVQFTQLNANNAVQTVNLGFRPKFVWATGFGKALLAGAWFGVNGHGYADLRGAIAQMGTAVIVRRSADIPYWQQDSGIVAALMQTHFIDQTGAPLRQSDLNIHVFQVTDTALVLQLTRAEPTTTGGTTQGLPNFVIAVQLFCFG